MPSFNEYLRQRYRCPWDYISFYSRWADLFHSHLEHSGARADDADALNAFLASQRGEMGEWQMRQAHRALYYYAGYRERTGTCPLRRQATGHVSCFIAERKPSAGSCHAIRLRHLAHRTEDTYRGWTSRFLAFTGRRQPLADRRNAPEGVPHAPRGRPQGLRGHASGRRSIPCSSCSATCCRCRCSISDRL